MVAKQHDDFIISGIDKNLWSPEMYTCGRFGCSIPDGVRVVRDSVFLHVLPLRHIENYQFQQVANKLSNSVLF